VEHRTGRMSVNEQVDRAVKYRTINLTPDTRLKDLRRVNFVERSPSTSLNFNH